MAVEEADCHLKAIWHYISFGSYLESTSAGEKRAIRKATSNGQYEVEGKALRVMLCYNSGCQNAYP